MRKKEKIVYFVYLFFVALVVLFSIIAFKNDEFALALSKIYSKVGGSDNPAYIKLFALYCIVCAPAIFYVLEEIVITVHAKLDDVGMYFSFALIIGFYFVAKDVLKGLPRVSGSETEMLWGFIPIFGGIKDFFSNFGGVYLWYAIPVIIAIGTYLLRGLIFDKIDNSIVATIVFMVVHTVAMVGSFILIPLLIKLMGGALGALVGIVAVAFIAFIIAVAIKSVADMEREEAERTRVFTLETGEVVERKYGNTYATMDGKEYERVASDKFREK